MARCQASDCTLTHSQRTHNATAALLGLSIMSALPSKYTSIQVDKFADEEYLSHVHVVERDLPTPEHMRPINPMDLLSIKTGYGGKAPIPMVPGSEGVFALIAHRQQRMQNSPLA